jgi:hypothetical protein
MFKFNFNVNDELKNETSIPTEEETDNNTEKDVPYGILDFDELDNLPSINERLDDKFFKKLNLDETNSISYFFIENSNLLNLIKNNENLIEMTKTHDLVNGKYEGGFKVWECSVDLSKYIFSSYSLNKDLKEFSIIELGCGHALPSLSLLKHLAAVKNENLKIVNVYLQDYNRDCIELITYLNVKKFLLENVDLKIEQLNIKFVYGDWKTIEKLLPNGSFDLVLTSETIYNSLYYKSLLGLCKYLLKDEETDREFRVKKIKTNDDDFSCQSCILLAAKTYYFGCGGNLFEFLNIAKSDFYRFKSLLVGDDDDSFKNDQTISREIVKLFN